jgi:hypothetical protein
MGVRSTIGAGLATLLALVMSGGGPVAAALPPAPTTPHDVALGVSIPDGRDLAKLDAFRAAIGGRRVATWTIWSQWGRPDTAAFPTAAAQGAWDRGAVPLIWWEPLNPKDFADPTFTRNRTITAGAHDAYIRAFATDAKAFGRTVLLRFAHQANSDYLPWAWDYSTTDDNTRASFVQMWRHVKGIFDEVGARNVRFVWSIATQTCARDCLSRPLGYPGDAYVDYLAFTWENWAAGKVDSTVADRPSIAMVDGYRPIVRRLSRVSDKPIIAVATASSIDAGRQPGWIRTGYRAVQRRLPQIVAIVYLDVDLSGAPLYHRDWSITGDSLTAYAEIAALPAFQGRIRPWWR